jgi:hypothetical protein
MIAAGAARCSGAAQPEQTKGWRVGGGRERAKPAGGWNPRVVAGQDSKIKCARRRRLSFARPVRSSSLIRRRLRHSIRRIGQFKCWASICRRVALVCSGHSLDRADRANRASRMCRLREPRTLQPLQKAAAATAAAAAAAAAGI